MHNNSHSNPLRFLRVSLAKSIAAVVLSTFSAIAVADEAAPLIVASPFLWEITPADPLTNPAPVSSYLFGTIHVPDMEITNLHPLAKDGWDKSEAAFFEIDFRKDSFRQARAISLPLNTQLQDVLPLPLLQRLDARLKKITPLARTSLPNAHVAAWPLLLSGLEAAARDRSKPPMDIRMYNQALMEGKSVGGLENPDSQLTALTKLPLEDQIEFLRTTLDAMDGDDAEGINRLDLTLKEYAVGDEEKLDAYLCSEWKRTGLRDELVQTLNEGLLTVRNRNMADAIIREMSAKPQRQCFFAVGIGHLVGEKSVQHFLRAKTLTVTRTAVIPPGQQTTPPAD